MPTCIIHLSPKASAGETAPPLSINGKRYDYAYGAPVDLPDNVITVARGAGMLLTILDEQDIGSPASDDAGNGDAAAGMEPGGRAGGGDSAILNDLFDPESIIKGTVADVAARLANLSRDQLVAVKAAEDDRESPRAGVADAIAKSLKAFEA